MKRKLMNSVDFLRGKGTNSRISILRILTEGAIEQQKDLYACLVDYKKSFDRCRRCKYGGSLIQYWH